jgi:predicted transcriptional regulator
MKNVTLSADENLIEQARLVARSRHSTLNVAFRQWLQDYVARSGTAGDFDQLMARLTHINAGRHFTRDEMNER